MARQSWGVAPCIEITGRPVSFKAARHVPEKGRVDPNLYGLNITNHHAVFTKQLIPVHRDAGTTERLPPCVDDQSCFLGGIAFRKFFDQLCKRLFPFHGFEVDDVFDHDIDHQTTVESHDAGWRFAPLGKENEGSRLWNKLYLGSNPSLFIDEIARAFSITLQLTYFGLIIAVTVSLLLGVVAAVYRDRWLDQTIRQFSIASLSAPSFWLSILLIQLLGTRVGVFSVFPVAGTPTDRKTLNDQADPESVA